LVVDEQVDYILGDNPLGMSFMTGFGSNYPQQVHHRGASIVSYLKDSTTVGCSDGYNNWYTKDAPNPNVHIGAIVGGPDNNEAFTDSRSNWNHLEPMTYINAAMCPVLAKIRATNV
jgi:endoglucanase